MFGDRNGDLRGGTLPTGENTITFDLYSKNKLGGDRLGTITRNFSIVNDITPNINQITANNIDDRFPQIDGNNLVWTQGLGSNEEIYHYDITTQQTQQISPRTNGTDVNPSISGNHVVWSSEIGQQNYAQYYNLNDGTTKTLSSDPIEGLVPIRGPVRIGGSKAIWVSSDSSSIFSYELDNATQPKSLGDEDIAINVVAESGYQINDNYAVWVQENAEGGPDHIGVYDFSQGSPSYLADAVDDADPKSIHLTDEYLVWGDNAFGINYYNLSTGVESKVFSGGANPKVTTWGDNVSVIWQGNDGDTDLYRQDIDPITGQPKGDVIPLTDNSFDDGFRFDVNGSRIAWMGGSVPGTGSFSSNIYYLDLSSNSSTPLQLTSQFGQDFPALSESHLAWNGRPIGEFGPGVQEIFLADTGALT
ncbi:MAG: hypothetical protein F6K30_22430 [Cyanothece sp. SIO2G6]|nr:hypothetical protein [Cyanothece sp. SIO2G6]